MTQLKVIIVDDEHYARESLRVLLEKDPEVRLIAECSNGSEAIETIRFEQPDVVFLDIQMPEIDGFEVLRQLDGTTLPIIIFSTAFDQYALQAFEVHALDYLLKPYSDQRFSEALARAKQLHQQQHLGPLDHRLSGLINQLQAPVNTPKLQRLAIRTVGKIKLVSVADIHWVEAADQYVNVHTAEGSHLHRESLSRIEQQLSQHDFFRTHRSALVSLSQIAELETYAQGDCYVHLMAGTRVRLARNRKDALENQLGL